MSNEFPITFHEKHPQCELETQSLMRTIPKVYEQFPPNYHNDIDGWSFAKETIAENKGKLLTLDIDFGAYCSLHCPGCFRIPTPPEGQKPRQKAHSADKEGTPMSYDRLKETILDAKKLGLRSVKFLGKGDMFENEQFYGGKPDGFIDFLEFLNENDIIPLIFTKGQILGDDAEVEGHFGYRGIHTSEQLIKKLDKLNCRIMLGLNAISDNIQRKSTGMRDNQSINARNRALKLLTKHRFNDPEKYPKTRLALATNPVTKQNINEIFDLYKWARKRHLYCVVTPSMMSGYGTEKLNPPEESLIQLYVQIYKWNIEKQLQTVEQIQNEGIASYAGGAPCNQVSVGMYVTLNGQVLRCPGNEGRRWTEGDLNNQSIAKIWKTSKNKKQFSGVHNVGCPAKEGQSIPNGFWESVMEAIEQ